MKQNVKPIFPEDITKLKNEFEVLTFPSDMELVYEMHVPLAGIILLGGSLEIFHGDEVVESISPPHMVGVANLVNEIPVEYGCRVKANSQVILIGKSKILDILKDKRSHLFKLFNSSVTNEAQGKIKSKNS